MAVLPNTAKAPANSHLRRNTDEIPACHHEAMTASLVLLIVVVVSGVLLGCLFSFARRPVSTHRGTMNHGDSSGWSPVFMSDGGGSDCSAADAGCDGGGGDGGGGGGGD